MEPLTTIHGSNTNNNIHTTIDSKHQVSTTDAQEIKRLRRSIKFAGLVAVVVVMLALSVVAPSMMAPRLRARAVLDDPVDTGCDEIPKTDQCAYIESGACKTDGRIDYLHFYYCTMEHVKWLAIILFVILLVILFYVLGSCAESYFCPALAVLADVLYLSPDVAGITILALGNGAPDVFSTIAAVGDMNFDIAIGSLTGAGVFVTCVVLGAVTLVGEATLERGPILRDTTFYLLVSTLMLIIIFSGSFSLWESSALLLAYAIYVAGSVIASIITRRAKKKKQPEGVGLVQVTDEEMTDDDMQEEHDSYSGRNLFSNLPTEKNVLLPYQERRRLTDQGTEIADDEFSIDEEDQELMADKDEEFESIRVSLARIRVAFKRLVGWKEKTAFDKLLFVVTSPIWIMFNVTIPCVDLEGYNRVFSSLCGIFSPLLVMYAIGLYEYSWFNGWLPFWLLVEWAGVVVALVVFLSTKNFSLPRYNWIFVFWAFIMSICWIFLVADELVSLLNSLGLAFHISPTLLGMTVLAWGNSIGDLVSNIVVAKQGYPAMAIAACFGGPLFNTLIGLGLSVTYKNIVNYPNAYPLSLSASILVSFMFLKLSLVSALVSLSLTRFKLVKPYAVYCLVLYTVYTTTNLLVEFHVVPELPWFPARGMTA